MNSTRSSCTVHLFPSPARSRSRSTAVREHGAPTSDQRGFHDERAGSQINRCPTCTSITVWPSLRGRRPTSTTLGAACERRQVTPSQALARSSQAWRELYKSMRVAKQTCQTKNESQVVSSKAGCIKRAPVLLPFTPRSSSLLRSRTSSFTRAHHLLAPSFPPSILTCE